jgi:2-polyprenyl-3-methyl-5-hydroxy-6-metoxy-1,4-benzoquinol methylase
MKDWTGNTKTIYSTLGASNHSESERAENDYYATDPKAIDYLLEKATLNRNIWECACGEGHLSKRLTELGYNVKSTDLIDRGLGGVQTFYSRMNTGMETFLLIRLTSMPENLLNTL